MTNVCYGAVAYWDDGITVFQHENLNILLLDLAIVLNSGQDEFHVGIVAKPEEFEAKIKKICSNCEKYAVAASKIQCLLTKLPDDVLKSFASSIIYQENR